MRRRLPPEPPSRLAHWARRLVLFALIVAAFAVLLVRGGVVDAAPGMVILGAAVVLALAGAGLSLPALWVIWMEGNTGVGSALFALAFGLALAAYPLHIAVGSLPGPMIADVTTDPDDPPAFEAIALLRSPGANPPAYAAAELAGRQRAVHPDIAPLVVEAAPEQAYAVALSTVTQRRWIIVDARSYQAGLRDGRIEAVARTWIMGFREDVAIRVRAAAGGGAVVDVRSASRYGRLDFGSNAERVRDLIADIGPAAAQAAR